MDIVYIVGEDRHHDYIELKYSIRSMIKHLDKVNRIVIVGKMPAFLQNVIHIPYEDAYPNNAARNIYEKILAACNDRRISSNFLYCSDDHFLKNNFITQSFPFFCQGTLEQVFNRLNNTSLYKVYVEATLNLLKQHSLPLINYNVHAPIIYNKKQFKKLMTAFDWNNKKGYTSKSLYCNAAGITGIPQTDCKVYTPKTKTAIYRKIKDFPFFSTNEHAINAEMKEVLEELYPEPSRFEK